MAYTVLNESLQVKGKLTLNNGQGSTAFFADTITQQIATDNSSDPTNSTAMAFNEYDKQGNAKQWGHSITVSVEATDLGSGISTNDYLMYFDDVNNHYYLMKVITAETDRNSGFVTISGINTAIYELGKQIVNAETTFKQANLQTVVNGIYKNAPFSVVIQDDLATVIDYTVSANTSLQAVLQDLQTKYNVDVDSWIELDESGNISDRIIYFGHIGSDNGELIRYGGAKGFENINAQELSDTIYTKLWVTGLTDDQNPAKGHIGSVNNGMEYILDDEANAKQYAIGASQQQPVYLEGSITNTLLSEPQALLTWAKAQMGIFNHPRFNYTVTPLHDQIVGIGDAITVQDFHIKPEILVTSKVIQKSTSFSSPETNTFVLGEFSSIFSDRASKNNMVIEVIKKDVTVVQAAADYAKAQADEAHRQAVTAQEQAIHAQTSADGKTMSFTVASVEDLPVKANEGDIAWVTLEDGTHGYTYINGHWIEDINPNLKKSIQDGVTTAVTQAKEHVEEVKQGLVNDIAAAKSQAVEAANTAQQNAIEVASKSLGTYLVRLLPGTNIFKTTNSTTIQAQVWKAGQDITSTLDNASFSWKLAKDGANAIGLTNNIKNITAKPSDFTNTGTYIVNVIIPVTDTTGTTRNQTFSDSTTIAKVADGVNGANGQNGATGAPGPKGADGKTTYVHVAYANSADGSIGFSTTDNVNKLYIGVLTDEVQQDSTDYTKYTWSLFKGADGADGADGTPGKAGVDGRTPYIHFAYANSYDGKTDFSVTDPTGRAYVGTLTDTTVADSTDPTKYTWSLIKGADGKNGSDGNGISSTTITYATSASGTNAPTSGYTSIIPTVNKGQFLWQRTATSYTNGTTKNSDVVTYFAKDGLKGADGMDGGQGMIAQPSKPKSGLVDGFLWLDTSQTYPAYYIYDSSIKDFKIYQFNAKNINADQIKAKFVGTDRLSASQIIADDLHVKSANIDGKITASQITVSSTNGAQTSLANFNLDGFDATVTKVDNLSVGGRNLFLGTKDFSGNGNWVIGGNLVKNVYQGLDAAQNAGAWGGPKYNNSALESQGVIQSVNDKFVMSAWVRNTGTSPTTIYIYGDFLSLQNYKIVDLPANSGWVRINSKPFGFTKTSGLSGSIRFEPTTSSTGGNIQQVGLKLEKGTIATDWTPAPEDVDSALSQVKITADGISNFVRDSSGNISSNFQTALGKTSIVTGSTLASSIKTQTTSQISSALTDNNGKIISLINQDSSGVQIAGKNIVLNGDTTVTGTFKVSQANIANGAIGTAQIGDATINNAKIANLDASKISSGTIDTSRLNVGQIFAQGISTTNATIGQTLALSAGGKITAPLNGQVWDFTGNPYYYTNSTGGAPWFQVTQTGTFVIDTSGTLQFDGTITAPDVKIGNSVQTAFYTQTADGTLGGTNKLTTSMSFGLNGLRINQDDARGASYGSGGYSFQTGHGFYTGFDQANPKFAVGSDGNVLTDKITFSGGSNYQNIQGSAVNASSIHQEFFNNTYNLYMNSGSGYARIASQGGNGAKLYVNATDITTDFPFSSGNISLNTGHAIVSKDNRKMFFYGSNGNQIDLGVRSLTQSSLVSLKEHIGDINQEYALNETLKVDVKQYNFIGDDVNNRHVSPMIDDVNGKWYIPKDWVSEDGKSVDVYTITGYLIQSIKALQTQITELKRG